MFTDNIDKKNYCSKHPKMTVYKSQVDHKHMDSKGREFTCDEELVPIKDYSRMYSQYTQ